MMCAEEAPSQIRFWKGDITEAPVEAIVNAANNRLFMGAGVAGAIKRKGGSRIEQEAVRQGPVPIGEAVVTSAGTLRARYCIHAVVMEMDFRTDADAIQKATRSALQRAAELRVHSVAFPALGTGVGRFPLARCAEVMLDEVTAHRRFGHTPETILFVLYDEAAYEAFERVWRARGEHSGSVREPAAGGRTDHAD